VQPVQSVMAANSATTAPGRFRPPPFETMDISPVKRYDRARVMGARQMELRTTRTAKEPALMSRATPIIRVKRRWNRAP